MLFKAKIVIYRLRLTIRTRKKKYIYIERERERNKRTKIKFTIYIYVCVCVCVCVYGNNLVRQNSSVDKCPTRCNYIQFILSVNCSTCFGWFLHPSSRTTVFTASGTGQPLFSTRCCRYSYLCS